VENFLELKACSIEELSKRYLQEISNLEVDFEFPFFEKAIHAAKYLRRAGFNEQQLLDKLRSDLLEHDFDLFSIRKVYQKSFNRPLEDDFTIDNTLAVQPFGSGMVKIDILEELEGVVEGSFVQFNDMDWEVIHQEDWSYVLKMVVPNL